LPAARLCCAGSREAFSEAEGEHSGLLSALEMAQEDEGETPSQLSVPSSQHYVHAERYIMDGKEGAKVVPLDNNRRLSPPIKMCSTKWKLNSSFREIKRERAAGEPDKRRSAPTCHQPFHSDLCEMH